MTRELCVQYERVAMRFALELFDYRIVAFKLFICRRTYPFPLSLVHSSLFRCSCCEKIAKEAFWAPVSFHFAAYTRVIELVVHLKA